jgi:hypothetical protein
MGIDGNHREICKFPSSRHHGYVAVLGALEDYVELAALQRAAQAEPGPSMLLAPLQAQEAVGDLARVATPSIASHPAPEMLSFSEPVLPNSPLDHGQDSIHPYSHPLSQLYTTESEYLAAIEQYTYSNPVVISREYC